MAENTKTAEEKNLSIEDSFARLDQMVKTLESPDVTLEDSFKTYQEGMKLIKEVGKAIDGYEKKIRKLSEDGSEEDLPEMEES